MKLLCDNCGKEIFGSVNFCPFCGEEAPRKTVVFGDSAKKIENPKYCPDCRQANLRNAMFCSICGEMIYKKPEKEVIFCGECGEKNKSKAVICCSCGISLADWFTMKGKVAEELSYKGNLKLTEKMNGITYIFLSKPLFTIGRREENDLVIKCRWVSGKHCYFDLQKQLFIDSSRNGTFINRNPTHIKSEKMPFISEFNVAGSFTFSFLKKDNLYCLHLGAILDEEECRRNGDGESFDRLRKNYYLFTTGDFKVDIQKLDGAITSKKKRPGVSLYTIHQENGYYYYTDIDRGLERILIMKDNNILPDHWIIDFV
jgi:hypothetical protein